MSAELSKVHQAAPLLSVKGISKSFRVRGKTLQAVREVSFELRPGMTLGVVGESGSGKSTLGRCVLRLLKPDQGTVSFEGVDISTLGRRDMRAMRQNMQLVYQNPLAALNPRATVARNMMDPLTVHRVGSRSEQMNRVLQLLQQVGLEEAHANAYVHELSGGQQQRVMVARALALNPRFVVCDEALSALDMSVQAQTIELLQSLQRDRSLSYLFISHNLSAVAYMSDVIAVMYLGEVVEMAPTVSLLKGPAHPYTRALFDTVLEIPESRAMRRPLTGLEGEIPSPMQLPTGCTFHTRCPIATDLCRKEVPDLKLIGDNHQAKCHFAQDMGV